MLYTVDIIIKMNKPDVLLMTSWNRIVMLGMLGIQLKHVAGYQQWEKMK